MLIELEILRYILATLAIFRLAQMVSKDYGPFFVFYRLRVLTDERRKQEQDSGNEYGKWGNLDELIRCPYCLGVWFALFCLPLVVYPTVVGDLILVWFGLAGVQCLIQTWTDKEALYP